MKKIGFFITARLKSTRLPLKLLKNLGGSTIIEQVIKRAKRIKEVDTIVLCTSVNPQDKPLIDISQRQDIYYFNGNEEDVLQRLADAAKLYNLDYILGITGENPLFSLEMSREIIEKVTANDYDFIYPKGLPIGCATYALKTKALETVCEVKKVVDTEIWGYLINRPEIFNIHVLDIPQSLFWPELRITLDYPEDYTFLQAIFENLDEAERLDLGDVLHFLKENPEILAIHADRKQLDLDQETKSAINDYFIHNKDEILKIKSKIYAQ